MLSHSLFPGSLPPLRSGARARDMPVGWRHWEPARKIEWLLQIPLDRCMEILSWDAAMLEPRLLAAQVEIFRVVLTIGSRAGLLGGGSVRARARDCARESDGAA
jgi:hypothetical protein